MQLATDCRLVDAFCLYPQGQANPAPQQFLLARGGFTGARLHEVSICIQQIDCFKTHVCQPKRIIMVTALVIPSSGWCRSSKTHLRRCCISELRSALKQKFVVANIVRERVWIHFQSLTNTQCTNRGRGERVQCNCPLTVQRQLFVHNHAGILHLWDAPAQQVRSP